jgi:plastocyanin
VTFLNEDPVRHNVYSPTEPDSFDLGAYATGQSRSVSFQAEGEHEVKCSIHVNMKLTITVKK